LKGAAKCLETHCGQTCSRLLAGFPQKTHDLDMRQKATDPLRRRQAVGRPRLMMRAMQLERSRTALRQATQAVEEMRAAKDDPDLFRYRFRMAMAAVQSVGSIIDHEARGHRTAEFGEWWDQTARDPLFGFMRDVLTAEFKRVESRQAAHHRMTLSGVVEVESALSFRVIRDGKVVQEGGNSPTEEPAASRGLSGAPVSSYSVEWSSWAAASTRVRRFSPWSSAT
jgi:hypothetical protein